MSAPRRGWEALNPTAQRALAIGGIGLAALALFGGVAVLMPEPPKPADKQAVIQHILTDSDPRSLGIDGLAAQLKQVAQRNEDLQRRFEALEAQQQRARLSDEERLRKFGEAQTSTTDSRIEALQNEIAALRRDPAKGPTVTPPAVPLATDTPASRSILPPAPAKPAAAGPSREDLDHLFEQPHPTPLYGGGTAAHPSAPAAPRNPLEIRVIRPAGATATPNLPATSLASLPSGSASGTDGSDVFVPAGTLLSGNLLNGLDAPTGKSARKEPFPVLARLKDEAILPNRFRADVRECFLVAAGYGDLSAERAYLRAETLSCVRDDGGVIEVPIDAYAVGEDGKLGLRGRVVSKQGQLLANALLAGFARGFSDAFGRNQVPVLLTGGMGALGSSTPFQRAFSDQAMEGGALKGAGYAMDRLAHYYMDLAENLFPVIEVDATRRIEFVVQRGTALKLAAPNRHRGRTVASRSGR